MVYDRTPSEIILNNKYYNDNTKAVITVDEVNFYAEDIDVTVKRRLNSENVFTDVSKEYSDLIKNSVIGVSKVATFIQQVCYLIQKRIICLQ